MSAAHTPGPWAAELIHHSMLWQVYSHGDHMVAQVAVQDPQEDGGRSRGLEEANARLIAAAPELLAALKGVLRVADRKTDEFDAARAAIAAAEGAK